MAITTRRFIGKCPNCCPDGGVEFTEWGPNEKRCVNCHHILPRRHNKPTGKPTPTQEQVIAHVLAVFGGSVTKQEMVGRSVWVEVRNDKRHWALGDYVYGTIGPRGQIALKMPRVGTGDAIIKDDLDIKVILGS